MSEQQLSKARELIEQFDNAMLITRSPDDELHARPMRVATVDEKGFVFFLTSIESPKVAEIERNPRVCVTMQKHAAYVAINGAARLLDDRDEVRRLWTLGNEVWFNGPDDPSAIVICVEPQSVEYWDSRGLNGLKFAFEALRAVATGQQPRTDDKQHGTLELSRASER